MAAEPALRIGSVFAGDFRILSPLDEGGMGLVYRAEQLSTGEERALKLLKPSLLADGTSRDRFAQEATIGAGVSSDHIVKVIGAGIDGESGIPWLAMELLHGDNLLALVRARGPLAKRATIEVLRQLCHALGAAHRVGVVHRDLKPENIFIARTLSPGTDTTVKLLDFGIAKIIQDYDTSAMSTAVVGSPLWMAPEQVRLGKIKPSTDVWALGLLAFWTLTGKFYWKSAQHRGAAQAEALLHEKLYEPTEAASRRASALGVRVRLNPQFDDWFKRCVARDPETRFRDATVAFAALERALNARASPVASHLRGAAGGTLVGLGILALCGLITRPRPETLRALEAWKPRAMIAHAVPSAVRTQVVENSLPPRSPALPSHFASHVHAARHANPQASEHSFRRRTEWDDACRARGYPQAWQVVPDWYASVAQRLHQREVAVVREEEMAERASSDGDGSEIAQGAAQSRRAFDRERAFYETQLASNVASERNRNAALARSASCVENGMHVDPGDVYTVWCCL